MKFANKLIESFGRVKVLRIRESFFVDHANQKIEKRGFIVASIAVPTSRVISADILVRAGNTETVQLVIESMCEWLYAAGIDKLFTSSSTQYYMARCAQVSVPEYSGYSARFTITFECADYRPYSARTDEPLVTAETDMSNFTFAGKHCLNDMGMVFVEETRHASPAVSPHLYEVSGRNGTLRYDDGSSGVLAPKVFGGTGYLVNPLSPHEALSQSDIEDRIHAIAAWLVNAKRAPLILDSDITRQWYAEIIDASTFSKSNWANGCIKFKLSLQPECVSVQETSFSSNVTLSANTELTVSPTGLFPNGMGYDTPLRIRIKNTGSTAITKLQLTYTDSSGSKKTCLFEGAGFSLASGSTIEVDSSTYDVSIGGNSAVKCLKNGTLPYVPFGAEKNPRIGIISNVATSATVQILCQARWL